MERNLEEDIKKLANEYFENIKYHNDCEFGSVGADCKRPFGNSDVEDDILEIIGWEMEGDDGYGLCYSSKQRDYAYDLYTKHMVKYINEKVRV